MSIMSMYKSFTLYFIVYVITIIDYFLSFIIRKITIDVLCISITICNMLFKQIKIKIDAFLYLV